MKTTVLLLAFVFTINVSSACSCGPQRSVEVAYHDSSVVFRGAIIDVKRETLRNPNGGVVPASFIEHLTLRVVKSWKGPKRGQVVHFRTAVSPGSCGLNARTANTKIFDREKQAARDARVTEWLVYASGAEPYALEMCTRTAPTDGDDWRGINDIDTLDWIVSHTGK